MYRKFVFYLTLMVIYGLNIGNAAVELGFMYLGDDGPFTAPALEFAKENYTTTQLTKNDLNSTTFKRFAVVWWHEGDTDPGALSNAEIDAFLDYAESGGAVLLTGWAIRYATPMGLEDVEARQFGPELDDGQNVGITVLQETIDHKLVDGLMNIDGKHQNSVIGYRSIQQGFQKVATITTRFGRTLLHLPMLGVHQKAIGAILLPHSVIGKQVTGRCLI